MSFESFLVILVMGGWIASKAATTVRLPGLLGMLVFGIVVGNGLPHLIPDLWTELSPIATGIALTIILLRAGTGIQWKTIADRGLSALLLSFLPATIEAISYWVLLPPLTGMDSLSAAMTGFMLAAVSPAVVVPSMISLQERGAPKELPTLVLAGASIDDVVTITMFTSLFVLAQSPDTEALNLGRILTRDIGLGLLGGAGAGALIGVVLAQLFKRFYTQIRATEKALIALMAGILLVQLGEQTGIAALLGVMVSSLVIASQSPRVGSELQSKLGKLWVGAEIILFVAIGLQVDLAAALHVGPMALVILAIGLSIRSLAVLISLAPSKSLSWNQRLFVVISYLPKATVQAALGALPLAAAMDHGQTIVALAVTSILVSAPLGLILIETLGMKLLGVREEQ